MNHLMQKKAIIDFLSVKTEISIGINITIFFRKKIYFSNQHN